MKIFKVIFSVFLFAVLGFVLLIPAQAKTSQPKPISIYPYPYFVFSRDISNLQPGDNVGSVRIPGPSELAKNLK